MTTLLGVLHVIVLAAIVLALVLVGERLRRLTIAVARIAHASEVQVVIGKKNVELSERMARAVVAPSSVATPVTTMSPPGRVQ